ncbi:hypothetical protein, partial [Proteus mirabilis]|uniref:hypothetical protein n=1 Tax=Proteus mirabilis TaxID=584 RepID=UPI001954BE54
TKQLHLAAENNKLKYNKLLLLYLKKLAQHNHKQGTKRVSSLILIYSNITDYFPDITLFVLFMNILWITL